MFIQIPLLVNKLLISFSNYIFKLGNSKLLILNLSLRLLTVFTFSLRYFFVSREIKKLALEPIDVFIG